MKSKIFIPTISVIAIILAIVFLREGVKPLIDTSSKFPYSSPTEAPIAEPSMQGVLTLLEKPILETPASLVFSFKSVIPAPNTEAKIELPGSFELVSGTLNWKGDLEANKEHKIEVVIKSTKVGYYTLSGSVVSKSIEDANAYFGDKVIIDIEITPNDAIPGSKPENNWRGDALPLPQDNEQIKSELILSNTPELNKNFTITYKARPLIKIPSKKTYLNLVFPQKAFKLINVQFPQDGETRQSDNLVGWVGNVEANQTVEITATLKVISVGWGAAYGSLFFLSENSAVDVKMVDLYIDKYGGKFTLNTPTPPPPPSSSTTPNNFLIKPKPTPPPDTPQPFSDD